MSVPTDKEYLQILYKELGDYEWINLMKRAASAEILEKEVELLIAEGIAPKMGRAPRAATLRQAQDGALFHRPWCRLPRHGRLLGKPAIPGE